MKTKLTIYQNGSIECQSKICYNKKECANHSSAGDFRCESGLTPRIKIISLFLGGASAECFTADTKYNESHSLAYCGSKSFKIKNGEIKGYKT